MFPLSFIEEIPIRDLSGAIDVEEPGRATIIPPGRKSARTAQSVNSWKSIAEEASGGVGLSGAWAKTNAHIHWKKISAGMNEVLRR